jgi:preprotein translocase subunit SecE
MVNFTFAARQYHQWADFRMLTDKTYWPQSTQNGAVEATLWIAVVTGILSVVCLLGGAVAVLCTWR